MTEQQQHTVRLLGRLFALVERYGLGIEPTDENVGAFREAEELLAEVDNELAFLDASGISVGHLGRPR